MTFRKPLRNSIHLGRKLGASAPFADRAGLINDDDRAGRLETAMPWVAPQSKAFVQSLLDYHAGMGGWTPKQSLYVDRMLESARDNYKRDKAMGGNGAWASKAQAHAEREPRVSDAAMSALNRMFDAAREAGLKRRRITLASINIVPSREGAGYAMFDNAMSGKDAFMGTILADGKLSVRKSITLDHAQKHADAISSAALDPGKAGRTIGSCIFCARELTDGRSLAKGYGPICAAKWNLPWGE